MIVDMTSALGATVDGWKAAASGAVASPASLFNTSKGSAKWTGPGRPASAVRIAWMVS